MFSETCSPSKFMNPGNGGIPRMYDAAAFTEARGRGAAPSIWRDLSRDWCRWSTAERVIAGTLAVASAAPPLFSLAVRVHALI